MPRVHNPDRILGDINRVILKTQRAIVGRHDHTNDEQKWLGRVHYQLRQLALEGTIVVRPRPRTWRRKLRLEL